MKDTITLVLELVDRHKAMLQRMKQYGTHVDANWRGVSGRELFVRWSLENGYSKELQLDRIDNKLGYFPENCQYISAYENVTKERRLYEFEGKKYTLKELHKIRKGVTSYKTFVLRMWKGWELEEALFLSSSRGNSWKRGSR